MDKEEASLFFHNFWRFKMAKVTETRRIRRNKKRSERQGVVQEIGNVMNDVYGSDELDGTEEIELAAVSVEEVSSSNEFVLDGSARDCHDDKETKRRGPKRDRH